MPTRVLIISHESPAVRMSGPAIRYWHLAHALARALRVTLAVPAPAALTSESVQVVGYARATGEGLPAAVAASDVILAAGYLLRHYPWLGRAVQPLVIDLYDPFVLENLEIHSAKPLPDQAAIHRVDLAVLTEQLARGDFFLCASDQQRDFWLGMLAAAGRINPYTLAADRTLRQLIDVVPFGVPEQPPVARRRALREQVPGIAPGDLVAYWGGGLWDWFDPLTAVRAVGRLAAREPRVKLYFSGLQPPNPAVPPMRQQAETQRLSAELGLTGQHVFFGDWVPYADRADYLLDADLGLSLHFDHVETRFSYRTRLLDYLWAGLPMTLTRGDSLGEQLASRGLARLVAPGDVDGVAAAMMEQFSMAGQVRRDLAATARELAESWRWSRVVSPLLAFCAQPVLAADRRQAAVRPGLHPGLLAKAWHTLRARGPAGLAQDIRLYLKL